MQLAARCCEAWEAGWQQSGVILAIREPVQLSSGDDLRFT